MWALPNFIHSNQLFPRETLSFLSSSDAPFLGAVLCTALCQYSPSSSVILVSLLSLLNSEKVEKFLEGRSQVSLNCILHTHSLTHQKNNDNTTSFACFQCVNITFGARIFLVVNLAVLCIVNDG